MVVAREDKFLWRSFFVTLFSVVSFLSPSLLGCATHLTWMAGVVEMFSEVNTTWVEEFKVVVVGTLQMEGF